MCRVSQVGGGTGQLKPVSTKLKRPYSSSSLESHRNAPADPRVDHSLRYLIGFAAPRDLMDAEYALLARPPASQKAPSKHYQNILSYENGHTMTNSTSIDLPKHWFGSGTHIH